MSHCYIRSDDSHLAFWMFWSKMNCEKLALYIYVMYIFCPQLDISLKSDTLQMLKVQILPLVCLILKKEDSVGFYQ